MKTLHSFRRASQAFTLTELLTIMAMVVLLVFLTIPAFAHAKVKNPAVGCLSNLRQMMVGWAMYKEDNGDNMMPNAPFSASIANSWCGTKQMNWGSANINTNRGYYTASIMVPYLGGDLSPLRCPADVLPSDDGPRLRSYSMNGQMGMVNIVASGPSSVLQNDAGAQYYVKGSDLTGLTPSSAVIFADESTYTLLDQYSDGYMQISTLAANAGFPDAPAARHAGACGFSFADGHAEIHRWKTSVLTSIPYAYGVTTTGWAVPANSIPSTNADFVWYSQHTACKANGTLGP